MASGQFGTGMALSVTLDQITDPDTQDATGYTTGYDACPGAGSRLVLVRLTLRNTGSTVLSGEVGTNVWFVSKAGVAIASYGTCDFGNATSIGALHHPAPPIETPRCATSVTSPNLPPGGSATVCRVTEIPVAQTIAEVELSNTSGGSNSLLAKITRTLVWYLTPPTAG